MTTEKIKDITPADMLPTWLRSFCGATGQPASTDDVLAMMEAYLDRMNASLDVLSTVSTDENSVELDGGTLPALASMLYDDTHALRKFYARWNATRESVATPASTAPESPAKGLESATRDALIAQLTTAYRSNRLMRNALATLCAFIENEPTCGVRGDVDLGWHVEGASDLADQGYNALIDAVRLIGGDEDDLAHFHLPDDFLTKGCGRRAERTETTVNSAPAYARPPYRPSWVHGDDNGPVGPDSVVDSLSLLAGRLDAFGDVLVNFTPGGIVSSSTVEHLGGQLCDFAKQVRAYSNEIYQAEQAARGAA